LTPPNGAPFPFSPITVLFHRSDTTGLPGDGPRRLRHALATCMAAAEDAWWPLKPSPPLREGFTLPQRRTCPQGYPTAHELPLRLNAVGTGSLPEYARLKPKLTEPLGPMVPFHALAGLLAVTVVPL